MIDREIMFREMDEMHKAWVETDTFPALYQKLAEKPTVVIADIVAAELVTTLHECNETPLPLQVFVYWLGACFWPPGSVTSPVRERIAELLYTLPKPLLIALYAVVHNEALKALCKGRK